MKNWIVRVLNHRGYEIENFVVMDEPEYEALDIARKTLENRTDFKEWKIEEIPDLPVGCIFDGCRGHYIGQSVQELALQYGWDETLFVRDVEDEHYNDATDEATEYLNKFVPKGHYADFNDGDWGVYPIHDEDDEEFSDEDDVFGQA